MKKLTFQRIPQLVCVGFGVVFGMCASTALDVRPANAASEIVFTYGPIGRSLSISELETFAETGEASRSLQFYLNLAELDPEIFQTVLTKELSISLRFLDRTLNSLPGEYVLFQLGQVINTGSGSTNIRALRSAFVLSASDDNRISLLEFLQNYPLQQLTIDGVELARVVRELGSVVEDVERRLETLVPILQELLEGIICDCAAPTSASPVPEIDANEEVVPTLLEEAL